MSTKCKKKQKKTTNKQKRSATLPSSFMNWKRYATSFYVYSMTVWYIMRVLQTQCSINGSQLLLG